MFESDRLVVFFDPGPRLVKEWWKVTEEDHRFADLRWVLKLLDGQTFPLSLGIGLIARAVGGNDLITHEDRLEKLIFGHEPHTRNTANTWHIISFRPVDLADLPAGAGTSTSDLE